MQNQRPRQNANSLPSEPDINFMFDREIEGLEVIPQALNITLSTVRNGWEYGDDFGSRITRFYGEFDRHVSLERVIWLEILRLANIPDYNEMQNREEVHLDFIEQVESVRIIGDSKTPDRHFISVELKLRIAGLSKLWIGSVEIEISKEQLEPRPDWASLIARNCAP